MDIIFIRGRIMRVFVEEKGIAFANGWVSREVFSGNLIFWMEFFDVCVYKFYDVIFYIEMKIEYIMEGNGFFLNMIIFIEMVILVWWEIIFVMW